MSGPIVRKYGFPNHDQIFGKEKPKHGVDEPEPAAGTAKDETGKAEEGGKKQETKTEAK